MLVKLLLLLCVIVLIRVERVVIPGGGAPGLQNCPRGYYCGIIDKDGSDDTPPTTQCKTKYQINDDKGEEKEDREVQATLIDGDKKILCQIPCPCNNEGTKNETCLTSDPGSTSKDQCYFKAEGPWTDVSTSTDIKKCMVASKSSYFNIPIKSS